MNEAQIQQPKMCAEFVEKRKFFDRWFNFMQLLPCYYVIYDSLETYFQQWFNWNFRYARPSTLKTHMRTHSGERPYKCFDCNKSFSQAANLTAHCRTHSGEKPFHCGICNRTFSQSSSVTTHMRTHSGERPYRLVSKYYVNW